MKLLPCLVLGLASSCRSGAPPTGPSTGVPTANLALTNASILDLATDRLLAGRTILIEGGKIAAIGSDGEVTIPSSTTRQDLGGQVVMAPLADVHVHGMTETPGVYLGFGITTVRVMWGTPGQSELADRIAGGGEIGPTIISASPGHDGQPASWPLTRFVETPGAARPAVERVAAEGWAFLKVYDRLSLAAYQAILAEAAARGIPVVGHVPFAVPLSEALALGQRSIEHLSGFENALLGELGPNQTAWGSVDQARMAPLAATVAQSRSWICPTLAITGTLARRNWPSLATGIIGGRRAMVKALYDAGAKLLVGTDAGIGIVPPGTTLADEMEEFVAAGVPRSVVLRLATSGAADFLGRADRTGSIEVGKDAELLILPGDPRTNPAVLRDPAGLLTGNRYYDHDALRRLRTVP